MFSHGGGRIDILHGADEHGIMEDIMGTSPGPLGTNLKHKSSCAAATLPLSYYLL